MENRDWGGGGGVHVIWRKIKESRLFRSDLCIDAHSPSSCRIFPSLIYSEHATLEVQGKLDL